MKVLVRHGKHGTDIYKATTSEQKHESALKIVRETHQYTGYYNDQKDRVDKILLNNDGHAAYKFLMERSGHGYEYETVEIQSVH